MERHREANCCTLLAGGLRAVVLTATLLSLPASVGRAGEIPRDQYLRFVPLHYPKLVRETDASRELHLFGNSDDRAYRDVAPVDGIDDTRGRLLTALATRFAPYMVRNTTAFPMNFRQLMEETRTSVLYVDEWQLTDSPMRVVRNFSIDFTKLAQAPCPEETTDGVRDTIVEALQRSGALDDCELLTLLRDFNPDAPEDPLLNTMAVHPHNELFKTLFFNFPGDSPETWKEAYSNVLSKDVPRKFTRLPMVYVHPFINPVGPDGKAPTYELVLQYWFFYPWNDGGNKHEGDWEHLGVVVTPRSKVGAALSASEIQAMLARGEQELEGDDPLVIGRLDYYIHNSVMKLDFSEPNAYLPRKEWEALVRKRPQEKVGEHRLLGQIRARAWVDDAETIPNTHPIVFIGADSKGPELLLYPPGARNRDSHASYPFPGLYRNIGPAAAAEEITKHFDFRKYIGLDAVPLPSDVIAFDQPERLELVPDWERIIDLVYTDVHARERWSWMLLPIRWGYPATVSPFAGIISHAETGNLAPVGPSFSTGWNRAGVSASFSLYDPHEFSGLIPVNPLDSISNSAGYLNIPIVALLTLPPFDAISKLVVAPTTKLFTGSDPVFFPTTRIPFRFVSVGAGYTRQFLSEEWTLLFFNSVQAPEIASRIGAITSAPITQAGPVTPDANGVVVELAFHLSDHWVSENTFRHTRSDLGLDVDIPGQEAPFSVRGTLDFWEWAGSIRYNILVNAFQPYLKLGYGLSWYRLTDVTTNGVPLSTPNSPWIRQPTFSPFANWLPNTWHYGVGIEVIPVLSRKPLPRGIDLSVKLEFAVYNHALGVKLDNSGSFDIGENEPTIHRPVLDLVGTLSF
jgi:hypothetical protein